MDIMCAGLRYSVCLCVYSLNVSHGGGARRWDLYAFTSGHPVVGMGKRRSKFRHNKRINERRAQQWKHQWGAATFEMHQQP